MSFNAEQTLHTGEVVGSIPTAPTIIIELSRQYSAACDGTHREYDASIRGKIRGICSAVVPHVLRLSLAISEAICAVRHREHPAVT